MNEVFFFGTLRDRELLSVVLGREVRDDTLIPACAPGHAALCICDEAYPHLAEKAGQAADGVLALDLSQDDRARLSFFEAEEYDLHPIKVETSQGARETRFFGTTAKANGHDRPWDFSAWQREDKPVAIEATRELMAHYGRIGVDEIDSLWRGIMTRARMRVRAKRTAPVSGPLRSPHSPEDIEQISIDRPYIAHFAVEEHVVRYRRFDGEWSRPIHRAAWMSGDAVTLLPYDPVRDEVLLIEQFRATMHARGDANPWGIETVAGRIDLELDAEQSARREAMEEAGLEIGRIERITGYYPTPGVAAEHITALVGEADLAGAGGLFGLASEDEDIRAFTVGLDKAMAGVASGEIDNAPVILSLFWLHANRDRLRALWT